MAPPSLPRFSQSFLGTVHKNFSLKTQQNFTILQQFEYTMEHEYRALLEGDSEEETEVFE